jgi:predicted porin
MKKSVIAIAVGAALAAAGAAQAETTIFGNAHLSIDSIDNGTDGYIYVNSNDSAIGFKGGEEIEGGLKAMWYIEQGFGMDGSSATTPVIYDKNTYAGLAGGFGAIKIGRIDSLVKQVGRKADLFTNQFGDARSVTSKFTSADARPGDQIVYETPKLGPAVISVAFIPEDGKKDASGFAVNAMIGLETMTFGVGYESYGETYTNATVATQETESTIRGIGAMTFGSAQVNFLVQSTTNGKGVDGQDTTAFGVGGAFKVGSGKIKAQLYSSSENDNTPDTEGSVVAVGYDHNLSKATMVYAVFAASSNGDAGTFTPSGGGHSNIAKENQTPTPGDNTSGISLGVWHKF